MFRGYSYLSTQGSLLVVLRGTWHAGNQSWGSHGQDNNPPAVFLFIIIIIIINDIWSLEATAGKCPGPTLVS